MEKKRRGTSSFGGPTVLTVLIILCFACFALLALSRAATNYRLSQRAAQTVSEYYSAESITQTALAAFSAFASQPPQQAGVAMAEWAMENGIEASFSAEQLLLTLCVDAGAQGVLTTDVRLDAAAGGTVWTTERSWVVPNDPEEADETLPVYQ